MTVKTRSTKKVPAKSTKKLGKKGAAKAAKGVAAKPKGGAASAAKKVAAKPVKKVATKPAQKAPAKPAKKVATKSARKAGVRSTTPPSGPDPTSDAALQALSAQHEAGPDIPVKVAQLEFASLARIAQTVAAPLAKVGITRLQIETLGRFAKRLGGVEAQWQKARASIPLSPADRKRLAEAEALAAKFLAGGRWACRKDDEALTTLGRIAEGSGLDDTIQDLHDLVAFWEAHTGELSRTDITAQDLTRATALAKALTPAAEKETRNLDAAAAFALRNRCYWAADELAKEIREAGRYAFRLQPKLAAKFVSRYRAAVARRARHKPPHEQKEDQPTTPPVAV